MKFEHAQFGTLTPQIEELKNWIKQIGVSSLAIESTGVYWIPVWHVLEKDFTCLLVNPYAIKQIPGRKSEVKDAQWIATLLQKGLLKGSYVPDSIICELRDYGRHYTSLCGQANRLLSQIDRILTLANIRISSMVSTLDSLSLKNVVKSIFNGESQPEKLITHVHARIINKKGRQQILASLTGTIKPQHVVLLKQTFEFLQLVEQQQKELLQLMDGVCKKHFEKEIQLLCTVPGIQKLSAMQIIAETGANMKQFPSAKHLVSWAGMRPRNDESAGKIKSRATTKGNKHLRRILVQSSWANTRVKNTNGRTLADKYRQLCKTKSRKKALIAIARKQLVIVYHVLNKGQEYSPYNRVLSQSEQEKKINYHLRQIEKLKSAVSQ